MVIFNRFTVKKTLEFGSCKLYAGVVRLNLDEKLLEASRVEFAREQAAAFVVAPNHLTDLTMLADEGHEVTALGNGDSEQAFGNGGQTQKAGTQINVGNDDGEVRVGEIHLHDAVPDTEFFIIAQGQIWDRMEEIFRRKAAAGVEVKIIFDDFGSMMRFPAGQIEALRESGVEVQVFNPVHHYVNRLYFNYRDHRKIVCIDGSTAYTGGANVADEYANLTVRFGYWKDCGIRLDGPGAWGLTREFLHMWQRNGGQLMQERDYYRPHDHREAAGFCQPFVDGPDNNPISTAEDVFLHLINNARRSVHITTPYLAIDEPMRQALCSAGDSGVDVRLLLPGIPDHKFAYLAAQSHYGELLVHRVKIYIYEPGLLHGKTVLSDGEAAFVGSVNMDYRSFQLHFECGTVLYGVPAIEGLAEDIQRITDRSRRVTYQEWKSRPWYRKLLSTLLRLFEMWM